MLTRFNLSSTRLMKVNVFGLSLVFKDCVDFKSVFNNLSIITN